MVFFLFSFSDLVKSFKTNSGSILRQVNVVEREKVGGRRSPNARRWQLRAGAIWVTVAHNSNCRLWYLLAVSALEAVIKYDQLRSDR